MQTLIYGQSLGTIKFRPRTSVRILQDFDNNKKQARRPKLAACRTSGSILQMLRLPCCLLGLNFSFCAPPTLLCFRLLVALFVRGARLLRERGQGRPPEAPGPGPGLRSGESISEAIISVPSARHDLLNPANMPWSIMMH